MEEEDGAKELVVDHDPIFEELVGSPFQDAKVCFQQLEQILNNLEIENLTAPYAKDQNAELLQQQQAAFFKLSYSLALMAQYKTTSTLKSLWSYFTSEQMNWDSLAENMRKDLEESCQNLLKTWHQTYQEGSGVDNNINVPLSSREVRSKSLGGKLEGHLLVDGKIRLVTLTEGVLQYSEEENIQEKVPLAQCARMERESSTEFGYTLLFTTKKSKAIKITVPFPHKMHQKQWLENMITTFLCGKIECMNEQVNIGHEIYQETCCFYLHQFTSSLSRTNKMLLVKSGAIHNIAQAVTLFPSNYNLHYWALEAINHLTIKLDYPKMVAAKENVIPVILHSMKTFQEDVQIQTSACKAIQSLAYGVEYNKIQIGNCGGIEIIVDLLHRFPLDEELQAAVIGCLANLSSADDNKTRIAECGGVAHVVRTMRSFIDVMSLQYYALGALVNLTSNDLSRSAVLKEKSVAPIVITAMKTFKDSEQLVYRGICFFLSVTAALDTNSNSDGLNSMAEETINIFLEMEGLLLLEQIQKRFSENQELISSVEELKLAVNKL